MNANEYGTSPMEWLYGGDTGISSKAIFGVMNGLSKAVICANSHGDVPHDPDDFGRCYRLLKLFPTYRTRLDEVAEMLPHWRPMVREWDKLTEMYERVTSGGKWDRDEALVMYHFMRTLGEEGRTA